MHALLWAAILIKGFLERDRDALYNPTQENMGTLALPYNVWTGLLSVEVTEENQEEPASKLRYLGAECKDSVESTAAGNSLLLFS